MNAQQKFPRKGELWQCVHSSGVGEVHKILEVSGGEVVTWSYSEPKNTEIDGHSFYGPIPAFRQQFKFCT